MRYLSTLVAGRSDTPPPPELYEAIMALGQEAAAAGVLLDQGGLMPQTRKRITAESGDLAVVDGPFTETKELLSYAIYEVRSAEEALEWTRRFMEAHRELWPGWSGESEVVQIMGGGDAPS